MVVLNVYDMVSAAGPLPARLGPRPPLAPGWGRGGEGAPLTLEASAQARVDVNASPSRPPPGSDPALGPAPGRGACPSCRAPVAGPTPTRTAGPPLGRRVGRAPHLPPHVQVFRTRGPADSPAVPAVGVRAGVPRAARRSCPGLTVRRRGPAELFGGHGPGCHGCLADPGGRGGRRGTRAWVWSLPGSPEVTEVSFAGARESPLVTWVG